LVAYPFVRGFLKNWPTYDIRSWVLDSGAYSVLTSGIKIDLNNYIDDCLKLMASECRPGVIFGLDVIGDPEATLKNVDAMKIRGVDAVPAFHYGSPFHYLEDMAKKYDRIALGGLVQRGDNGFGTKLQYAGRIKFLERCFAIAWPKWMHGFGCVDKRILRRLPLASADSISWRYHADRFGCSVAFGRKIISKKTNAYHAFVRADIDHLQGLEREARSRFAATMRANNIQPFQLRFACDGRDAKWFAKTGPNIKGS
jgi:hypothetical protein